MFTTAPWRLVRERLLILPFYEVAVAVILLRKTPDVSSAAVKSKKDFRKQISPAY
jgi:hypothetical protein